VQAAKRPRSVPTRSRPAMRPCVHRDEEQYLRIAICHHKD
jgi:hypothetical protein